MVKKYSMHSNKKSNIIEKMIDEYDYKYVQIFMKVGGFSQQFNYKLRSIGSNGSCFCFEFENESFMNLNYKNIKKIEKNVIYMTNNIMIVLSTHY